MHLNRGYLNTTFQLMLFDLTMINLGRLMRNLLKIFGNWNFMVRLIVDPLNGIGFVVMLSWGTQVLSYWAHLSIDERISQDQLLS